MKKLGFIFATMILVFTMQAQNQHGNVSVHTYSTGHYNNSHNQNNGNHYNNNHQWNNHQVNNHSNNGHHQHGNNGNHYGNNHNNAYYGNNPNNAYYGNNPQYNGHYPQPVICHFPPPVVVQQPVYYGPSAMDIGAFQTLKATINNEWFSSGQMDVFNQALAYNHFTAQQVTELVALFDFNSDQLKVAKKAYTKTIDPENYFIVNSALQYTSSVRELTAYIASI